MRLHHNLNENIKKYACIPSSSFPPHPIISLQLEPRRPEYYKCICMSSKDLVRSIGTKVVISLIRYKNKDASMQVYDVLVHTNTPAWLRTYVLKGTSSLVRVKASPTRQDFLTKYVRYKRGCELGLPSKPKNKKSKNFVGYLQTVFFIILNWYVLVQNKELAKYSCTH